MEFLLSYSKMINNHFDTYKLKGIPASLYEPINYLMEFGGKRIRPSLTLMTHGIFDDQTEYALDAAFALELFHNFSLMHDDIMDNASLRRGNETVHCKYDVSSAILSGDVMLVYCYQFLAKYGGSVSENLIQVFNDMAIKLCEGQRLDMDFEIRDDVEISEYLKMIEYKTAVLIACSLEFGAITAQTDVSKRKGLSEFGRNIGIAFQIHDDILDSFGNEEEVGKKPAGDILQNKKTYLYLKTKELADAKQLEKLNHFYSYQNMEDLEKIEGVKKLFINTGALEYANQLRDAYKDLAISHLKSLGLAAEKEQNLIDFANYLIKRSK
jgi:geranylgeranyl diphosphate synthase, type II